MQKAKTSRYYAFYPWIPSGQDATTFDFAFEHLALSVKETRNATTSQSRETL